MPKTKLQKYIDYQINYKTIYFKKVLYVFTLIRNFFERRATNAAAESFNAKIKAFRAQFRGVRDKAFFLYRLTKLYA